MLIKEKCCDHAEELTTAIGKGLGTGRESSVQSKQSFKYSDYPGYKVKYVLCNAKHCPDADIERRSRILPQRPNAN